MSEGDGGRGDEAAEKGVLKQQSGFLGIAFLSNHFLKLSLIWLPQVVLSQDHKEDGWIETSPSLFLLLETKNQNA